MLTIWSGHSNYRYRPTYACQYVATAALQIQDRSPESRPLNQSQTQLTRPVLKCNAPQGKDIRVLFLPLSLELEVLSQHT